MPNSSKLFSKPGHPSIKMTIKYRSRLKNGLPENWSLKGEEREKMLDTLEYTYERFTELLSKLKQYHVKLSEADLTFEYSGTLEIFYSSKELVEAGHWAGGVTYNRNLKTKNWKICVHQNTKQSGTYIWNATHELVHVLFAILIGDKGYTQFADSYSQNKQVRGFEEGFAEYISHLNQCACLQNIAQTENNITLTMIQAYNLENSDRFYRLNALQMAYLLNESFDTFVRLIKEGRQGHISEVQRILNQFAIDHEQPFKQWVVAMQNDLSPDNTVYLQCPHNSPLPLAQLKRANLISNNLGWTMNYGGGNVLGEKSSALPLLPKKVENAAGNSSGLKSHAPLPVILKKLEFCLEIPNETEIIAFIYESGILPPKKWNSKVKEKSIETVTKLREALKDFLKLYGTEPTDNSLQNVGRHLQSQCVGVLQSDLQAFMIKNTVTLGELCHRAALWLAFHYPNNEIEPDGLYKDRIIWVGIKREESIAFSDGYLYSYDYLKQWVWDNLKLDNEDPIPPEYLCVENEPFIDFYKGVSPVKSLGVMHVYDKLHLLREMRKKGDLEGLKPLSDGDKSWYELTRLVLEPKKPLLNKAAIVSQKKNAHSLQSENSDNAALWEAIYTENFEVAEKLIQQGKVDIERPNAQGYTFLLWVNQPHYKGQARLTSQLRARLNQERGGEMANESLQNELRGAALSGHYGKIIPLIQGGANPNLYNERGYTIFLEAVLVASRQFTPNNPYFKTIQHLIEHGAKVDDHNLEAFNRTPVMTSITEGNFLLPKVLIEAGADIERRGGDQSYTIVQELANHSKWFVDQPSRFSQLKDLFDLILDQITAKGVFEKQCKIGDRLYFHSLHAWVKSNKLEVSLRTIYEKYEKIAEEVDTFTALQEDKESAACLQDLMSYTHIAEFLKNQKLTQLKHWYVKAKLAKVELDDHQIDDQLTYLFKMLKAYYEIGADLNAAYKAVPKLLSLPIRIEVAQVIVDYAHQCRPYRLLMQPMLLPEQQLVLKQFKATHSPTHFNDLKNIFMRDTVWGILEKCAIDDKRVLTPLKVIDYLDGMFEVLKNDKQCSLLSQCEKNWSDFIVFEEEESDEEEEQTSSITFKA